MKKLDIDLDELVEEATWNDDLEVGPLRYFDRETGGLVFVESTLARALDDGEDLSEYEDDDEELETARLVFNQDLFLPLPERWPDENFQIMEDFVRDKTRGTTKDALAQALKLRKPFRQFKDTLCDYPEVRDQYFEYEAACHRQWIVDWLHSSEIEPVDKKREKEPN